MSMRKKSWLDRVLNSLADRGRDLLRTKHKGVVAQITDAQLCQRLIQGKGEASNIALARDFWLRWIEKSDEDKIDFLYQMSVDFDPSPAAIKAASQAYRVEDPDALRRLIEAVEPPRQELIRRLNMAPEGTAHLIEMRSFLLSVLKEHPRLRNVDYDFKALLSSWFNRGFLVLKRIDWHSPAAVLEKLMQYEAVHPMSGWDDMRRRLSEDRRCYAFFHPAIPDDPLIFVEVALTQSVSRSIHEVINPDLPVNALQQANTAIFYSINNALDGLRGISFGNFLIKQVVTELQREFDGLETFSTLSPMPTFRRFVDQYSRETNEQWVAIDQLLNVRIAECCRLANKTSISEAIDALIDSNAHEVFLLELLQDLSLLYLTQLKRGVHALDPVAHFHLSNGAELFLVNPLANKAKHGLKESWGCMVNYRYDIETMISNHESYVTDGVIALGDEPQTQLDHLLDKPDSSAKKAS